MTNVMAVLLFYTANIIYSYLGERLRAFEGKTWAAELPDSRRKKKRRKAKAN